MVIVTPNAKPDMRLRGQQTTYINGGMPSSYPHGRLSGEKKVVDLGKGELITSISGTADIFVYTLNVSTSTGRWFSIGVNESGLRFNLVGPVVAFFGALITLGPDAQPTPTLAALGAWTVVQAPSSPRVKMAKVGGTNINPGMTIRDWDDAANYTGNSPRYFKAAPVYEFYAAL